jgi:hypothetical protein
VGLRTNDGLNILIADDGSYHFTSTSAGNSAKKVEARAERFKYEYQVLSHFNIDWAERNVRETAAMFRKYGQPEDIALLPDICEPL